ncbi:MAG: L,D-transpeptidase family protein [Thiohalocapsa sp.]
MYKPTGKIFGLVPALILAVAIAGPAQAARHHAAVRHHATANKASQSINEKMVEEQVLLDRAGFSPGVIDGRGGGNTDKALHVFQQVNGLPVGPLDQATAARLAQTVEAQALAQYTIAPQDVAGPFVQQIPKDFAQMAALPRLDYQSPRELLAEKFHMSEDLLAALNPGKNLAQAGTVITVANVGGPDPAAVAEAGKPGQKAQRQPAGSGSSGGGDRAARIVVDKRTQTVAVYGADNRLLAFYPATVGSTEKRAPSGTFQVRDVVRNPDYTYNPTYAFKGQHATQPVKVPPGPNNPVGLVWIGLNAKGYGIHGTPDPDKVGKTQSHGCVRLTNWDALALARLVKKGTQVDFVG